MQKFPFYFYIKIVLLLAEDGKELTCIFFGHPLPDDFISIMQMQEGNGKAFAFARVLLLLLLYAADHVRRHGDLLQQVASEVVLDLFPDYLVVVLFLQLNPGLLLENCGPFETLRHVGFGDWPGGSGRLEEVSELFLSDSIFHLICTPPRQVPSDMLPAIAEPDVALLENLVFFPGPWRLSEVGVQMISVALSDMFAFDSREGVGQLIPAEFPPIELHQLYQFFIFFGSPKTLGRLQVKIFMFVVWFCGCSSVGNRYLIDIIMTHKSLLLAVLVVAVLAAVDTDLINRVPGYPQSFAQKVYSGYLNTNSSLRKLHYVFVESSSTAENVPLTLWLNGGPGCSSLLGFLQEIGPYFLDEGVRYKVGDELVENPYSWHKESHLLFLESPPGVGYSINNDSSYAYNDASTLVDNFDALLDFFVKYPEYSDNIFWLAGESYAGKYIPDLATFIDVYNTFESKKINLKGILVGNGVMNFLGGTLESNRIEYLVNQEFVDPDLLPYYRGSCLVDPESAGCQYFKTRFQENVDEINPYNVYSYCFYNDSFLNSQEENNRRPYISQASILMNLASNKGEYKSETPGANGAPCAFFDGLFDYFTAHGKQYHSLASGWNGPCAEDVTGKYHIDLSGSISEYRYLLDRLDKYHIILYNGDWDAVVPFIDTVANLEKLNLKSTDIYKPFFALNQHAGWTQLYGGLLFVRMKGASHQVPQSKRAEAYELFKMAMGSISEPEDPTVLLE